MNTYQIVIDINTNTNPAEWNWDNFLNLDVDESYSIQSVEVQ